jgi:hypothetical protein
VHVFPDEAVGGAGRGAHVAATMQARAAERLDDLLSSAGRQQPAQLVFGLTCRLACWAVSISEADRNDGRGSQRACGRSDRTISSFRIRRES